MHYRIFNCGKTYALYQWGKDRFGLWIPLQRFWRDGEWRHSPAIPGYLFIPIHSEKEFRRKLPPMFKASPLYSKDGRTYDCDAKELGLMQEILNGSYAARNPAPALKRGTIKVGDEVSIDLPIFSNWKAKVEKLKPGNKARIEINGQYVDVDMGILRKTR